jgi:hypothetical protein
MNFLESCCGGLQTQLEGTSLNGPEGCFFQKTTLLAAAAAVGVDAKQSVRAPDQSTQ